MSMLYNPVTDLILCPAKKGGVEFVHRLAGAVGDRV